METKNNTKSKNIINDLLNEGFDYQQIADAMEDGAYLYENDIDQDTAEEVYDYCVDEIKRIRDMSMTRDEAHEALKKGKVIVNRNWENKDFYIKMESGKVICNCGVEYDSFLDVPDVDDYAEGYGVRK